VKAVAMSTTRGEDAVVLALTGELDLSQVGPVEAALRSIEASKPARMVLDLSGLTFMDSSGLRLVLETDRRARLEARALSVVPGPEQVHRVFLIALLDRRLDFIEQAPE
jgi:anti-anti-sigma factor